MSYLIIIMTILIIVIIIIIIIIILIIIKQYESRILIVLYANQLKMVSNAHMTDTNHLLTVSL